MSNEPAITLEQAKDRLKSAIAPRVTEESIKAKIDAITYMLNGITTVCFIKMRNGFQFVGMSTPASPLNYDAEVGQRYAYDNAFKQIWAHEVYILREQLHAQEGA